MREIIFDEYERAERVINEHRLCSKPRDMFTLAAKYYYANGYNRKEVRQLLDDFLLRCNPNESLASWSGTLDIATKNAEKYKLIHVNGIDISTNEMLRIEPLKRMPLRRLAFVLLCAAKYWDAVNPDNDHWVNLEDKDIMKMANITAPVKRQSIMFSELRDAGMIQFAKRVDNLNVQVIFIEPGETALHIQDVRNLGYQYEKYYGGSFITCENCGLTVRAKENTTGRPQKYCPSCAVEVKTKQSVESVMRQRKVPENKME